MNDDGILEGLNIILEVGKSKKGLNLEEIRDNLRKKNFGTSGLGYFLEDLKMFNLIEERDSYFNLLPIGEQYYNSLTCKKRI